MATVPLFLVAFWSQTQKKCCPVAVADNSSLRTSHAAMPTNRPRIRISKLPRLADQRKGFLVPAASSHASHEGIMCIIKSISSICFQEFHIPSWGNIFCWLIPLKAETLNTSPLKPWKPYGLSEVVSWESQTAQGFNMCYHLLDLLCEWCEIKCVKYHVSPEITVLKIRQTTCRVTFLDVPIIWLLPYLHPLHTRHLPIQRAQVALGLPQVDSFPSQNSTPAPRGSFIQQELFFQGYFHVISLNPPTTKQQVWTSRVTSWEWS